MRKIWFVACAFLFISTGLFAQSMAPLTREALAAILSPAAGSGPCGNQQGEVLFAARRPSTGPKSLCTATAQCESGTVSCQGNSSCTAVDRNCSTGERGHVTCDGNTTNCSTACSSCDICAATGDCFQCCRCEGNSGPWCVRECSP
jgi:hypothetical protein